MMNKLNKPVPVKVIPRGGKRVGKNKINGISLIKEDPASSLMASPYRFVRSAFFATITGSTTVDTLGAFKFTLADLPDYGEFTNLFDQYRISALNLFTYLHLMFPIVLLHHSDPLLM